jgi:F0F1-type ATP synthase delta subunit
MFWVWLVLIQLVVFTALIFFLKMLLTRNISSATSQLHEMNSDYNQKVEDANRKKADVDKYYDEMLRKAKTDAEKTKVQILKEVQEAKDSLILEARRQSEEIISQAHKAQETAMGELDKQINNRAVDKACELLGLVLNSNTAILLHALWVKELLKVGLDEIERLNLPEDMTEIRVQTAFAMDAADKATIEKAVHKIIHREVPVVEEVHPELIAGLKITLGSLVIDGSLKYKIKEVSKDVKSI